MTYGNYGKPREEIQSRLYTCGLPQFPQVLCYGNYGKPREEIQSRLYTCGLPQFPQQYYHKGYCGVCATKGF